MTSNQREIWNLYSSGHSVTEIAKATGRAKSTISVTLKRIRNPRRIDRVSTPCVYSSSCFTCPLRECTISGHAAIHTNVLPGDLDWGAMA